MFERLNFDHLRQQVPQMIWKRFPLPTRGGISYFLHKIDSAYAFLLREYNFKSSVFSSTQDTGHPNSVNLEFIHTTRGRNLQDIPREPTLESSPGYQQIAYAGAFLPVDGGAYNVCADAIPQVKNRMICNYLYLRNENIKIKIHNTDYSGGDIVATQFVDIVLIGYYIPDPESIDWS